MVRSTRDSSVIHREPCVMGWRIPPVGRRGNYRSVDLRHATKNLPFDVYKIPTWSSQDTHRALKSAPMQNSSALKGNLRTPRASTPASTGPGVHPKRQLAVLQPHGDFDRADPQDEDDEFALLGGGGPPEESSEPEFPEDEAESQVYSRDQRRSRRKRGVRARTINMARFAQSTLEEGRSLYPETVQRPHTREECQHVPRPCPFVSCRHHLYLDVSPRTGSIKINFPDLEVDELSQSCALDVAESGPLGAEELGEVMNLTRERVRQIEQHGLEAVLKFLDLDEASR